MCSSIHSLNIFTFCLLFVCCVAVTRAVQLLSGLVMPFLALGLLVLSALIFVSGQYLHARYTKTPIDDPAALWYPWVRSFAALVLFSYNQITSTVFQVFSC